MVESLIAYFLPLLRYKKYIKNDGNAELKSHQISRQAMYPSGRGWAKVYLYNSAKKSWIGN